MLTQEAIFIATIKGTSLVIKTRPFVRFPRAPAMRSHLLSRYAVLEYRYSRSRLRPRSAERARGPGDYIDVHDATVRCPRGCHHTKRCDYCSPLCSSRARVPPPATSRTGEPSRLT